ncbi:MAG: right-handed parallel beta-helix repeat-containing protein, partial [bacterium]
MSASVAAQGTERWVAPDGDDAGPGTRARPWRTLAKAAGEAGPGTTVYLASGTWRERLIPKRSGTAAAPVVFAAAPGATPVLDGQNAGLAEDMAGVVHLEGLSWIEVRGLTVQNAGPGEVAAGILGKRCEHIVIRGCRTEGTASSGIGVWFSKSVLVEGNDVADACRNGSQECISVAGCDGFEIAGNTVHDCAGGDRGGEGIDAKHGSHGRVHGNVVHHIRRLGIYVDAWDVEMRDIEVWGNLVHDTKSNGYALAAENNGALVGIRFHDNVAYRNAHVGLTLADWGEKTPHHGLKDIVVERNTFIENGTSG